MPSSRSISRSAFASQTASTPSRLHPPTKTARRRKFLFSGIQEVVAPVHRGAECLLARGKIFGSAGEQLEPAGEAGEEGSGRENFDVSGGELDRERQAIETSANLRDGGGVFLG